MRKYNPMAMMVRTPTYRPRVTKNKKREDSRKACRGKQKETD